MEPKIDCVAFPDDGRLRALLLPPQPTAACDMMVGDARSRLRPPLPRCPGAEKRFKAYFQAAFPDMPCAPCMLRALYAQQLCTRALYARQPGVLRALYARQPPKEATPSLTRAATCLPAVAG